MKLKCECGFEREYEGDHITIDMVCPKCKMKMKVVK
jgi:predicted Zn-ribbon and HTH transcriptional regulator